MNQSYHLKKKKEVKALFYKQSWRDFTKGRRGSRVLKFVNSPTNENTWSRQLCTHACTNKQTHKSYEDLMHNSINTNVYEHITKIAKGITQTQQRYSFKHFNIRDNIKTFTVNFHQNTRQKNKNMAGEGSIRTQFQYTTEVSCFEKNNMRQTCRLSKKYMNNFCTKKNVLSQTFQIQVKIMCVYWHNRMTFKRKKGKFLSEM